MNLVGKIFTVVIFLLCVVFGTFALMVNAAHKDWKAEVMDLNQKEIAATKLRDQLKVERQNLETALNEERERTKRRLVALENEKNMVVADQGSKDACSKTRSARPATWPRRFKRRTSESARCSR